MAPFDSPWIISRNQDLLWFWGGAWISLSAGALAWTYPALALPLFCAWLLLVDGPHFWATWTRSYFDAAERARRGPLLEYSLLIFLPGFATFAIDRLGNPAPFAVFTALVALWGWHHFVRQSYGIWALYARRASVDAAERRLDRGFCYLSLWSLFFWFSVAHPLNREEIGLPLPAAVAAVFGWLTLGIAVAYAGLLAVRARRSRPVIPGLFLLLPNVALQGLGFWWIGMAEPLIPGFTNLEQAFAVLALANGATHGLQYVGLVAFAAKNRFPAGGPSLAARISARPVPGWLVYVALSVPYVALNLARGAAPGVSLRDPLWEGLAFCLYAGFVCHHYLLDQYLWRPHLDEPLRRDLRLA